MQLSSESVSSSLGSSHTTDTSATNQYDDTINCITEKQIPFYSHIIYREMEQALKGSEICMIRTKTVARKITHPFRCLVIDIGGTTARIAAVDIDKQSQVNILEEQNWMINSSLKILNIRFLDIVCDHVKTVIESCKEKQITFDETIKVGLAWSFPFQQTKPNNGFITVAGKGYQIGDELKGVDFARVLEREMLKVDIKARICSVVNDAASVYAAGLQLDECQIGLVVGTGLNASFEINNSVLNSELSFFGPTIWNQYNDLITTQICGEVPEDSFMRKHAELYQPLEYMCAGRYFGEMVRLKISSEYPKKCGIILTPYSMSAELAVEVGSSFSNAQRVFETRLGINLEMCIYQRISDYIDTLMRKSGIILCSALLACAQMVKGHSNRQLEHINIGFVGSFFKYYTNYRTQVDELLPQYSELVGLPPVTLRYINQSNLVGAAICAASLER